MPLIKTNFEIPRGDDPVKQAQRLAMDLSANFKAISSNIQSLSNMSSGINTYVDIVYVLNGTTYVPVSHPHGLGTTPVGWFVIDITLSFQDSVSIIRTAWDETSLTLVNYSAVGGSTATCTVRVFI